MIDRIFLDQRLVVFLAVKIGSCICYICIVFSKQIFTNYMYSLSKFNVEQSCAGTV
jgi:hypothetical protein